MNYIEWNNLIARKFFNENMAGREVLLYVNEDTTISMVLDSAPYTALEVIQDEISDLQDQVTTLQSDLEAQATSSNNNLYGGIVGGAAIGLIIGVAIMFIRK